MLALLSSATIDIIGLAGFGYDFAALSRPADDPSELMQAFNAGFTRGFTLWTAAQVLVPALAHVPTPGNLAVNRARATMDRIGRELVTERKQALARADAAEKAGAAGEAQRDVLSLLLRANAAAEAGQRLGDADVRAQIPTFLLAGHETTSTGATWALYSLAQQPALLAELREEIRSLPLPTDASGNEPLDQDTLAELDQLPLLDAVVRETLRLYSPVPNALRQAMHDTVIPLATPFTDRHGVQHNEIRCASLLSPPHPSR
jgi:cytochrome P450